MQKCGRVRNEEVASSMLGEEGSKVGDVRGVFSDSWRLAEIDNIVKDRGEDEHGFNAATVKGKGNDM